MRTTFAVVAQQRTPAAAAVAAAMAAVCSRGGVVAAADGPEENPSAVVGTHMGFACAVGVDPVHAVVAGCCGRRPSGD